MSERKAINKYYPPDWDPSKVPRKKKVSNAPIKVRLMTPFSMRCSNCNEYIASRRKFNARKESTNEKYMNVEIKRFHITCPRCNNNIIFKTNPQTAGYAMVSGARKNFEPGGTTNVAEWKPETEEEILERLEREEKENENYLLTREKRKKNPFWTKTESLRDQEGDVMENLEKRIVEQQRQQEMTEEIEMLQAKNAEVRALGGTEKLLEDAKKRLEKSQLELEAEEEKQKEQDEKAARLAFLQFNGGAKEALVKGEETRKRHFDQSDDHITVDKAPKKQIKSITIKKTKPMEKQPSISTTTSSSDSTSHSTSTVKNNTDKGEGKGLAGALGYSSSDED